MSDWFRRPHSAPSLLQAQKETQNATLECDDFQVAVVTNRVEYNTQKITEY